MLIADYTKVFSPSGVRLEVEATLLDGEPVAEITCINSGAALVLIWPDEAIVLPDLDGETVVMLALQNVTIYERDSLRELRPQPAILPRYN